MYSKKKKSKAVKVCLAILNLCKEVFMLPINIFKALRKLYIAITE